MQMYAFEGSRLLMADSQRSGSGSGSGSSSSGGGRHDSGETKDHSWPGGVHRQDGTGKRR